MWDGDVGDYGCGVCNETGQGCSLAALKTLAASPPATDPRILWLKPGAVKKMVAT